MRHLVCPASYRQEQGPALFLAGGITACPDWQTAMVDLLKHTELTLLNPRRQHFDVNDPTIEEEQIRWEFTHLEKADGILFWFCAETLCPITLFEYGKWITQAKPLFVGCHPGYKRRRDVTIQTRLVRLRQTIHDNLESLAQEVVLWADHP